MLWRYRVSSKFTMLHEFVELKDFTEAIERSGDPDLLERIQTELSKNPSAGSLIKGGVRKARVGSPTRARGKRGGYRVFYFYVDARGVIYLILLLDKRESENISLETQRGMEAIVRAIIEYERTR
jgi:mRNA-degrading endonuclease RelE of RelBE toxin-antitoxin system